MDFKKAIFVTALFVAVSTTSGCELFQPQETIDPVTGEVTVVPVGPPSPSQPRDRSGPRGGGGSGGWGS